MQLTTQQTEDLNDVNIWLQATKEKVDELTQPMPKNTPMRILLEHIQDALQDSLYNANKAIKLNFQTT